MALKFKDKKSIVVEISDQANSALSAVVANYRGLDVNQMNNLRKKARILGIYLRVVRNNLMKIAVKSTKFECMHDIFSGPLVIAFSKDPSISARLFKDFMKDNINFKVKYLSIGGKLFTLDKLEDIANLPNKEEAFILLCNTLQMPVIKFTRTINEISLQLIRLLVAISHKK